MFDVLVKILIDLLNLNIFWIGFYDECYSDSLVVVVFFYLKIRFFFVKLRFCIVFVNLFFVFGVGGGVMCLKL